LALFFGFEHALDPLYHAIGLKHKPLEVMDNINNILVGAIGIGAVMIVISILINIVISFKKKNFTEAIFSNNGIFGLMFFCSLVYGIVSLMLLKTNVFKLPFILVFLVIPVLMMFLREPLGHLVKGEKFKIEGIGDFIASNFFEVFEFLLGYATNTLSFLRVGGFVFLHAGMMSVVMLLSETAAKGVSPIIIIIGNIFVMAMEGLIVGIQVLRLEFYEIFSRCYDGDGKAFSPIKVHYNSEVK
jgi:V/A-type H+-transporting ATPase subunit I